MPPPTAANQSNRVSLGRIPRLWTITIRFAEGASRRAAGGALPRL
ncbi:MAG: hypothetical protein OXG18_01355 [Gemmatimonadetes bacterium]|nr:hypothetical protein [Gemmatimonadota bacterium]